jgi:hypothetical protein
VQDENNEQMLLEKLKEYNGSISSIEARALLMYNDGDKNYGFQAVIAVQQNGERIRLDLSDFVFKKPVLTLIKNNDQVTALLHMKKKGYLMSYDSMSIEELSGFKLRKEILLPALMGKVFVDTHNTSLISPDSKTLIMESDKIREMVTFDAEWLPRSVEYEIFGDVYIMNFVSFSALEDHLFPEKVTLSTLNRQLEATYKDVRVNGYVDDGMFIIDEETLSGYTIEYL